MSDRVLARIGGHEVGDGRRLLLIAGPCVMESEAHALAHARKVKALAEKHGVPAVFKASFDKANRSSGKSYRGIGLEKGLAAFEAVKRETGLPCTTDVHEPWQAEPAGRVVDVLQVPAFLCRQTDLVLACAKHGRSVSVKKGQFLAPKEMRHAVAKCREAGQENVLLVERGATFGYGNLVVDMRGLVIMREPRPGVPRRDALGAAPRQRRRHDRRRAAVRGAARARGGGGRHRRALHRDPRGPRPGEVRRPELARLRHGRPAPHGRPRRAARAGPGMSFPAGLLARAARVRLVLLDVDGVLTDRRIWYGPEGEALKAFDVRDGHGIVLVRDHVDFGVISGRPGKATLVRLEELRFKHLIFGERNKLEGYARLAHLGCRTRRSRTWATT